MKDNVYAILNSIEKNSQIGQRELSKTLGVSLGSVNTLINKMVKEGLIKSKSIPKNKGMYMLTPKGMLEKTNKTYQYVKHHYGYINDTKEKIKVCFNEILLTDEKTEIVYVKDYSEIDELVMAAMNELESDSRNKIHIKEAFNQVDKNFVVCVADNQNIISNDVRVVRLMEKL